MGEQDHLHRYRLCLRWCLTALRYPEQELVSVPAHQVYYEPTQPLVPGRCGRRTQRWEPGSGRRRCGRETDHRVPDGDPITIREENAIAALEVMSRFAVDPRWLVYLPPTMSPTETSDREGLLEHPHEAFAAFRAVGVERVVCEEKHMGSRAVVVVCRDRAVARSPDSASSRLAGGAIFTRTGRPFFSDHWLRPRSSPRFGPVSTPPRVFGGSSGPTGWCSTANCFPGQPRRGSFSDGSTPPSGRLRGRDQDEADLLAAAPARGVDVGDLRSEVHERGA